MLFIISFSACKHSDVDSDQIVVELNKGNEKQVKIGQENLKFSLVDIIPIFSEGVVEPNGNHTNYKVFDTKLQVNDSLLVFRTMVISNSKSGRIEKTWEQLESTYQGILSIPGYKLGISSIHSEKDDSFTEPLTTKILVKKD